MDSMRKVQKNMMKIWVKIFMKKKKKTKNMMMKKKNNMMKIMKILEIITTKNSDIPHLLVRIIANKVLQAQQSSEGQINLNKILIQMKSRKK